MKLWSSQLWAQFLQLRREVWKIQDFNGVWTRALAIPVRHSNQLSYEATDVGSWSFVGSNVPWGMNQWWNGIYEMNHIWTADMKLISTIHVDALDTEKPEENHATKKQNLTWTESTCTCTVLVHIAYSVCYSTVRVKCSSFYICFSKRLCKK